VLDGHGPTEGDRRVFRYGVVLVDAKVTCDGTKSACEVFGWMTDWCVEYVNQPLQKPTP
jgi:hypothetical protein